MLESNLSTKYLDILDKYLRSNAFFKESIQNQIYEQYVLGSIDESSKIAHAILHYNELRGIEGKKAQNNQEALSALFNNISEKLHSPDKELSQDVKHRLFNIFKDIGENLNAVKHSKAGTTSLIQEKLQFIELWAILSYDGMKQVELYLKQAMEVEHKPQTHSFWSFICKLFSDYCLYYIKKEDLSQEKTEEFVQQIEQDIEMIRNYLSSDAKNAVNAWEKEEKEIEQQEKSQEGPGIT